MRGRLFGKLCQIVLENNPIAGFPGFQVCQGFIGLRHGKSLDYRRNLVSPAKLDHPTSSQWTTNGRARHRLLSRDQRDRQYGWPLLRLKRNHWLQVVN